MQHKQVIQEKFLRCVCVRVRTISVLGIARYLLVLGGIGIRQYFSVVTGDYWGSQSMTPSLTAARSTGTVSIRCLCCGSLPLECPNCQLMNICLSSDSSVVLFLPTSTQLAYSRAVSAVQRTAVNGSACMDTDTNCERRGVNHSDGCICLTLYTYRG